MTIRTKQEKLLWDIIKLGKFKITIKKLKELNLEMSDSLIHNHLNDLKRRRLIDKETIITGNFPVGHKSFVSINMKNLDRIKNILKEELENSHIEL